MSSVAMLAFGTKVGVLYTVQLPDCDKPFALWWVGVLDVVTRSVSEGGEQVRIEVTFEKMFGFESSQVSFKVVDEHYLRDEEGTDYPWTLDLNASIPLQEGFLVHDEDEISDEVTPVKKQKVGTGIAQVASLRSEVVDLCHKVTSMENMFKMLSARIADLERSPVHFANGALQRRLSFHLQKFMTRKISLREWKHNECGIHLREQNVLVRRVDCTLSDFDHLLSSLHSPGVTFTVTPTASQFKAQNMSTGSATFTTFEDMCLAFGIAMKDVSEAMVRKKLKNNATVQLEFMGTCMHQTNVVDGCMVYCIGGNCQNWDNTKVFLYRASSLWNNIDGAYMHPLSRCTKENWEKVACGERTAGAANSFSIDWKALDNAQCITASRRGDILGCASVRIPYVVLRGADACEEFLTVVETVKSEPT